jgi:hypothetical protein
MGHRRLADRTAKISDLDPQGISPTSLPKIANRHRMRKIDELLTWACVKADAACEHRLRR